ncbi:hypothetical protein [Chitinophaga sp. YIM B06452]|uniref:hypothetical protein n=1 Tax=Chitinophaga sp. YIM B06452 TaxID=3082158 RepID=UPI0031FEA693
MKSQANQDTQAKPGQVGQNSQQPPGKEGNQERERDQGSHGQGGGQPKPGLDKGENQQQPDIPQEVPKREIERKPSDPQSEPDTAPKPEMPDKGPDKSPKQEIPENEENTDVEEKSPDIVGEERETDEKGNAKKEESSLVDSRDRFPFPNK